MQIIKNIQNNKRWFTLVGTVLVQFSLGSVYMWSLFNKQLSLELNTSVSDIAVTFGILCLSLAFASSLAGKLKEMFGVRLIVISSGILFLISLLVASQATNVYILYLSAGFLLGFADGAGYLLTLSNCVRWFPDRKGLVSAIIISAYGLGALGFKKICTLLLEHFSLNETFIIWGIISMSMIMIGSLIIYSAPDVIQQKTVNITSHTNIEKNYSLRESVKLPQYWMLDIMFLTTCMAGLYTIGIARDIGLNIGLDPIEASTAVTVISFANISGRLILGILSDKILRIRIITFAQILTIIGIAIILFTQMNQITYYIALFCIVFSFGGTITVFPSLVSDFFGLKHLEKNYGLIYLGFGFGAIIGSIILSIQNNFNSTYYLTLILLILSLTLSILIKKPRFN